MKIKEIIVVEGKNDKTHLNSFLDADVVTTNGSALDLKTLVFLKEINKKRGIIVLTDPDYAGEKIRNKIQDFVGDCKHVFVKKEDALGKNKIGIETTSKENILKALKEVVTFKKNEDIKITQAELFEIGLIGASNSKEKRKQVCEYFHIGWCNGKTLLKRLSMLGVTIIEVKEVIK